VPIKCFIFHGSPSQARVASANSIASANFDREKSAWLSLRENEKYMQNVVKRWQWKQDLLNYIVFVLMVVQIATFDWFVDR
jgi:hypothetical protein